MLMTGTSASGGRSPRTWLTLALISASASVASKLIFRRAVTVERPWVLCDWMYSIPSAEAMARSSGVVMNPRTRSALAPM